MEDYINLLSRTMKIHQFPVLKDALPSRHHIARRMLTFLVIETTHQRLSHNYPMFQHAELNTDLPWIDRKFTNVTKSTDIDFGREILEGVRGRRVQETSFLNSFL